jgi:hypothetical protein
MLAILVVALAVRAPSLAAPANVVLGWRSADMASAALSYFEHGMRFLYPEVFWGGAGPNYVEMEFPIVPYLVAIFYSAFGFNEALAAAIPLLSGVLAPIGLFLLARRYTGDPQALLAGLLFAASPSFAAYTQMLVSDGPMTVATVFAVLAFDRWLATSSMKAFAAAVVCTSLAGLLKPYALIVYAPIGFLAWSRYGARLVRQPSLWAFGALSALPVLLWYTHAYFLGRASGNSVGVLAGGYSKLIYFDLVAGAEFWLRLARRLVLYHLTPIGVLGCVAGLLSRAGWSNGRLFIVWLGATCIGALVVAEGTHQMLYYAFPLLPPAFVLAGIGIVETYRTLRQFAGSRGISRYALAVASAAAMATVPASLWAYRERLDTVPFSLEQRALGERIARYLPLRVPIVLITADYSGGGPSNWYPSRKLPRGQHQTPPELFYFSGHRGWYLAIPWVTQAEIDALRERGAGFLVIGRHLGDDVRTLRSERPDLVDAWSRRYELVADTPDLLIFDVRGH